jgi:hypothetical protein
MIRTAMGFQMLVATALAVPTALPGCPESCGDVRVPYPFGIGRGCFREGFNLTCDGTRRPPKLFMADGVEVLHISLPDGTVRVQSRVLWSPGGSAEFNGSWSVPAATRRLKVSSSRNSFVAFGCNVVAQVIPYSTLGPLTDASICAAVCPATLSSPSCLGAGCCRTSISPLVGDLPSYGIQVKHLITGQDDYAYTNTASFIVDQEWFNQNEGEMMRKFNQFYSSEVQSVPTVLELSFHLILDEDMFRLSSIGPNASDFICLSVNSFSYSIYGNYDQRRCNCSEGYQGNPYLSDGCRGMPLTPFIVLAICSSQVVRGSIDSSSLPLNIIILKKAFISTFQPNTSLHVRGTKIGLLIEEIMSTFFSHYFLFSFPDIDECQQPDIYTCHGTCINLPGSYRCSSKKTITSLPGKKMRLSSNKVLL